MSVPQQVHFLVGSTIVKNRQDACSTTSAFSCGEHHCQEQARCLFHNKCIFLWGAPLSRTGKMPVPQQVHFLVGSRGWAGEPAHKKLIENGARI
ncbi:hypothetical protein [Microcoleus vaginatus]|uniref:hypothetical protein n=1 Tax=Microcoleus vaginatus TaxID=119532 RepID=UPI001F62590A